MVKRINLALQGGGAHGAFTWGVLDRLLEEPEIEIAGISGTSTGALNGAALKAGLVDGGRDGAKANLAWLWGQVGALNDMRLTNWMAAFSPAPGMISKALEYSLPFSLADATTRLMSPYSYGPLYQNPLDRIVRNFRFDEICAEAGPELHICATNVRTGKIRVFTGGAITPDAILASACLPTLFQAVEMPGEDGERMEAYWDGGYTGNPALFPLFAPGLPRDIVVVNINPLERDQVPVTSQQILNRINEISFNSSLLRELRAIHFVHRLIAEGRIPEEAMKNVLMHMIADDELMTDLSVATKLVPSPTVLAGLKQAGRRAAGRFLEAHYEDIGTRPSIDLEEMFG
ncbi:patatin-like phospholipase family protein [Tranquillimonas alkanivorans]|uniref:NTE family protein n=1 Tax=Tranquillimonas alkanivorans TaxID=441119 RepID=A0A1I5WLZ8_9RHOB|nr:patatin-like phospholipase family protein [Tranquillimonas alkanivorans]SFQ20843.1 NTE family protein [Tranquillimonas alkanivorans]